MKPNKKSNTYKYVDLGLPSGTLWANRNVGAKNETDCGLYFACAETKGYSKSDVAKGIKRFDWLDYKWGDASSISKYNKMDGLSVLLLEDDAANINMHDEWSIPTLEQLEELVNYAKTEWLNIDGVNGIKFSSKNNDNYLFIPCSGKISDGSLIFDNLKGFLLSTTFNENNEQNINCLRFSQNGCDIVTNHSRCTGTSVRGVINNINNK